MNEKEEITIGTNQKSIIEYIFDNPCCTFNQIKKNFKGKISLNNLKFYLRGKYDTEGKYEEAYLIRIGHIISSDEDKYGNHDYPDIFEVNEAKTDYYPDLVQKTYIDLTEEIDLLKNYWLKSQVDAFASIIDMLMQFGINIKLVQKPNAKKIYLSDLATHKFSQILKLMIYECFLNNPDVWYVFFNNKDSYSLDIFKDDEEKKELDFSINIKLNFSKVPHFYERLGVLLQYRRSTRDLYDNIFSRKYYSLIKEKKKNRKLEHIDNKSSYANAKFESEERKRIESRRITDKKELEKIFESIDAKGFENGSYSNKIDLWHDLLDKKEEIEKELGYFKVGKWLKKKD